jgi:amino acid permease
VAPALLSLPYAFTLLGWTAGIICLVIAAMVTFYSYNLLSLVLERQAQLGNRQLRFRDMARDILGNIYTATHHLFNGIISFASFVLVFFWYIYLAFISPFLGQIK